MKPPLPLFSHVSLGTNDLARAGEFYDVVLGVIGCRRLIAAPRALGYGRSTPEFWIEQPFDQRAATAGNGVHVAFAVRSRAEVDAFYAAALGAGAYNEGAPGPRPTYGPEYYGCYVRDPDGNKIEATFFEGMFA